jgi:hypothetical protein
MTLVHDALAAPFPKVRYRIEQDWGHPEFLSISVRASGGSHCFGEIFPANVWVTIFPFCTMKVSVPTSKWLSAVSAFHTM